MSILVGKDTRVVVQGITGSAGRFHTAQCREYGTRIVAGVTPGKGGGEVDGIPIFDTVREAVETAGANASMLFVPPAFAADAILEAVDAGCEVVVPITEGIPVQDMIRVKNAVVEHDVKMIGPNCPGIITPGACKIGILPGYIHKPGTIGIISRSGTLTYEAVWQLSREGFGQSTCIGIGGDPIVGLGFLELLARFQEDEGTEAIVLIGEIGGTAEEQAAAYIRDHVTKPVVAFIAGRTAPPGRRMGHAGAIISGGKGTAKEKVEALEAAGVRVAANPARIGAAVRERMEEARGT